MSRKPRASCSFRGRPSVTAGAPERASARQAACRDLRNRSTIGNRSRPCGGVFVVGTTWHDRHCVAADQQREQRRERLPAGDAHWRRGNGPGTSKPRRARSPGPAAGPATIQSTRAVRPACAPWRPGCRARRTSTRWASKRPAHVGRALPLRAAGGPTASSTSPARSMSVRGDRPRRPPAPGPEASAHRSRASAGSTRDRGRRRDADGDARRGMAQLARPRRRARSISRRHGGAAHHQAAGGRQAHAPQARCRSAMAPRTLPRAAAGTLVRAGWLEVHRLRRGNGLP